MNMTPPSPIRLHKQLERIWGAGRGIDRLAAVNHTTIGKRFMATALVFFAIGGLLAMLIRTQLASSNSAFMGPALYAQVFTMHGVIMMFLFSIPFFEGLAIYLLPKMLGARDLAFPRMSAYGYWCYLFGGSFLILSLVLGIAPNGGWFMYPPLTSGTYTPDLSADVWLLGITFVEISALSAAVELAVSILKVRAPGMSLTRMPIFAWYILVVAFMMLIGFPPLILGSILLEFERAFDLPFFDPLRGGDPLLWQHLFWLFGHPEVYIIFLPAAGALSTLIPTMAQRPLDNYGLIVVALIAMGFISFGLWVHHMYTVGIPHVAVSFFSAASALVAVPTGIQIFAWISTLAHGRPRLTVPMLHVFGFFFVFVLGGLTGVMLAMVPFDWQAHDSHFVVAHLHYVLVGGFIFPMMAAVYYWLPHIVGKQPIQHLSKAAFWLIFIGFNTTFFTMHLTGLRGMPRRVHAYPENVGWELLNLVSSVGGFVMTIGFALLAIDLFLLIRFGKRFRRDPWEAGTLEWATPTPAPAYNFASIPFIDRRADRLKPRELGPKLARGDGYLGFVRHERMETLAVDIVSGRVEQIVILPPRSFLPLITAIATAGFFAAFLFKLYAFTPLFVIIIAGLFFLWSRQNEVREDEGPLDIGRGEAVPTHFESLKAPSHLAMIFVLAANATLYASLVFGSFFLWLSAPNWPPPNLASQGHVLPLVVSLGLALAAVAARFAQRGQGLTWLALALAGLGHLAAIGGFALLMMTVAAQPTSHSAIAAIFVIYGYAALHSTMGLVFVLHGLMRLLSGAVSQKRNLDLRIARLWHDYTAIVGVIALGFVPVLKALIAIGGQP